MKTAKDYLKQPYTRNMIPTEPKGFHAELAEFPGCFAQGDTVEEAYLNLEKAAESWIEACISQGQSVPEPCTTTTFSGRIVLRLPRLVHKQAARLAERDQTSLNTFLVSAVSAKVGAEDFYVVMADKLERRMMEAANVYRQFFTAQTFPNAIERRRLKIKQTSVTGAHLLTAGRST